MKQGSWIFFLLLCWISLATSFECTNEECNIEMPKLFYFNARGRAELSRLILEYSQTPYKDVRLGEPGAPTLQDLKQSGILPFGQVPVYIQGNFTLAQSLAIARYLGKKNGLYGENPKEEAWIDMLIDGVEDVGNKFRPYRTETNAAKKATLKQELKTQILPQWLGYFESLFFKSSTDFFSSHLSIADLAIYNMLETLLVFDPLILEKFPGLKSFRVIVESLPNISNYVHSGRRPALPPF